MKRKFLPLFLTCALVLSSSMAFAADVNETVEGDALTAVSEEQEEAAVEEETQEEVVTGEAKENVPVAYSDDETNEPDNGTNNSDVVYDFGKAFLHKIIPFKHSEFFHKRIEFIIRYLFVFSDFFNNRSALRIYSLFS